MSQNPFVLGLHFAIEVAALAAIAYWGWTTQFGLTRWMAAIGLPLLAAVVWGVFRAAGDGPQPVVAIPGLLRLALELVVLGGAALLLWWAGQPTPAVVLIGLVLLDYALSYDRVWRLATG